jgi:hypothetical protein
MERSRINAPGVTRPTDVLELMQSPGPFLTVWAARTAGQPFDARAAADAAVRKAGGSSIPERVVEELTNSLATALAAGEGAVAVADGSGVRLVEELPSAPRSSLAREGELPSLSPVIEHRQADIPFVLVVSDRQGADVYWSGPDDTGITTVDADEDQPVSKPRHGGGWAHRRMQQKVENTWEQTANEVAQTLVEVVEQLKPRVITLGGDVRMTQLLRERVPESIGALLREVPGSRSEDGSDEHRDNAIRRWVRTAVAEDTVAVLRLFEQERGQQDRAADGPSDTLAALRESRVDVLLVHDDPEDDRVAWFVDDVPTLVADNESLLQSLGYDTLRSGRLVDVAIRAALATGAGIRIVPSAGPVSDVLGAILRW